MPRFLKPEFCLSCSFCLKRSPVLFLETLSWYFRALLSQLMLVSSPELPQHCMYLRPPCDICHTYNKYMCSWIIAVVSSVIPINDDDKADYF